MTALASFPDLGGRYETEAGTALPTFEQYGAPDYLLPRYLVLARRDDGGPELSIEIVRPERVGAEPTWDIWRSV